MTTDTRRLLADAIHTHAFAVSQDPRAAAQVTDLMLAQVDRELTYYSLVEQHRALIREVRGESERASNVHVLGDRPSGDAA